MLVGRFVSRKVFRYYRNVIDATSLADLHHGLHQAYVSKRVDEGGTPRARSGRSQGA
jgi:hypothetical protein